MFKEIFEKALWENRKTLTSLENTKELRAEIQRLKKLMLRQSDDVALQTMYNIKYLEKKLKGEF